MPTTVATDEPEIAANSAQATTPASPSPPYQCPISEVAKSIMRRATPPSVSKLPARMKNGIAMISKRSMLVNSFSPTIFGSTSERMNRYVSTERPSAIEIGMPDAISASNSANSSSGAHGVRQFDDVEPGGEADERQRDRQDDDQRRHDGVAERPRRGRLGESERRSSRRLGGRRRCAARLRGAS